jgi:hypothetical protein
MITSSKTKLLTAISLLCCVSFFSSSCSSIADNVAIENEFPDTPSDKKYRKRYNNLDKGSETLFGDLTIGGPNKKKEEINNLNNSINLFLWRAALETLSIGPLDSADPFGGIITTGWFNLEGPDVEYRITTYILGSSLRPDNVKVAMYMRTSNGGRTVTKRSGNEAEKKLKNVILNKARTIRATQYR